MIMKCVAVLLLCLLPTVSSAQCVLPEVIQDDTRDNLMRGIMGWWIAQRGKIGGSRWVDIVKGRVGTFSGISSPATSTSGWNQGTSRRGGVGELRLAGASQQVTMGSVALPSTPGKATCAWAYATAFVNFAAFYRHDAVIGPRYNSAGQWSDDVNNSTGASSGNFTFSTTAFPLNVWTHVCAVLRYTTSIQVDYYLNAKLDKTTSTGLTDTGGLIGYSGTAEMRIGTDPGATGRSWTGRLDDILVWQRALSAAEVQTIYHDSLRGHPRMLCSNQLMEVVPGAAIAAIIKGRRYAY